jgi:hypothetical protein
MIDFESNAKSLRWIAASLLIAAWVVWTIAKELEAENERRTRLHSVSRRTPRSAGKQQASTVSAIETPEADQSDSSNSDEIGISIFTPSEIADGIVKSEN